MRCHFVHDGLPCSPRHSRIMCCEICTRQIEIQRWFAMRFVHRVKLALGFVSLGCAKCSLLLRVILLPIKHAVMPAIHSVFELHVFLHVEENERAELFPLASSGGVAAGSVRIVHSQARLLANLLAFLVSPVLPAGETALPKQFKKWLQR
jgi:hypothetical protein